MMHYVRQEPINCSRQVAALWVAVLLGGLSGVLGQPLPVSMAFTVSMPQPSNHLFQVECRAEGLKGEVQDFKMPAWHPGFYRILDYAKNVQNFRAEDGSGAPLPWEKTTRNTWRVVTGNAPYVLLKYDVLGTIHFAAQNELDESRAFIAPTGMFLYAAGRLGLAATVRIELPPGWSRIATGLEPVAGKSDTFAAPDFDTLYDCPILIGNQETHEFLVQGKPHKVAIESIPPAVDRSRILADLKRIVETATRMMGDIPYKHYAFLMMGTGNGGIEHSNSSANLFNGNSLTTEAGYRGWLSFIAHEYFHLYNVKRMRPLALGPFDYDVENLTSMLWVSEGLSVYYQDLLLVRAGILTQEQYLDKMQRAIGSFENSPGRRYQSATDASLFTWGTSGVGNDRNTTISYYNNGSMLGAMLDLKIRAESGNRKSLDDVLRALYRKYYQEKKRGFTDTEFRAECEAAAGGPLDEVFSYASTTVDVDYPRYFALAGLEVSVTSEDAPGGTLGLNTQSRDGKLIVAGVSAGSPAEMAGVATQDQLLEIDGAAATPKAINDVLAAKAPGSPVKLKISRGRQSRELDVTLGKNSKRTFQIRPMAAATELQSAILKDWLRPAQ